MSKKKTALGDWWEGQSVRASLRRPKCEKAVKTERGGANRFGEARGSGMQSRRSLLCYKHRWGGKLDGGAATISRNMGGEPPEKGGGWALLLFGDLAKVEFFACCGNDLEISER